MRKVPISSTPDRKALKDIWASKQAPGGNGPIFTSGLRSSISGDLLRSSGVVRNTLATRSETSLFDVIDCITSRGFRGCAIMTPNRLDREDRLLQCTDNLKSDEACTIEPLVKRNVTPPSVTSSLPRAMSIDGVPRD